MIRIISPSTPKEWEDYFSVRYATLRKEWGQPTGSEHLDDDKTAFHALAIDETGNPLGVCRLHLNTPSEGQIRMMGVVQGIRTQGVGTALIRHFEDMARQMGATRMVLDARDYALGFYKKNGYTVVDGKTHILWGQIPHFWMEKEL